jgi:hypothetical protein
VLVSQVTGHVGQPLNGAFRHDQTERQNPRIVLMRRVRVLFHGEAQIT